MKSSHHKGKRLPFNLSIAGKWLIVIFPFTFSLSSFSQTDYFNPEKEIQLNQIQRNDAAHPCITSMEYAILEKQCAENSKLFPGKIEQQKRLSTPSLKWPLQTAPGFTDCGYYVVGYNVDQDTTAGAISDWNCGTRTYDGHRGIDISIWPFPFNKVDNNQVEVIAAAAGTIINKHDGEFDRNCVGVGTPLQANFVMIQHPDGSIALYWHVKNGSVTTKAIGQTVEAGEYLAVVASSGSSGGPHLHFEVWAGSTNSTRIDPYLGPCNSLNTYSWWESQKPYTEPAILKASVHITDYTAAACPNSDSIYESTEYALPFTGPGLTTNYAKFYIFFRDLTTGSVINLKILNPDETTFNSWSYTFQGNYLVSYYGWSKHLPSVPGSYSFQAIYNGVTCSQDFTITTLSGISELDHLSEVQIYPNPSSGQFTILLPTDHAEITVTDMLGRQLIKTRTTQKATNLQLNENAVYLAFIKTRQGTTTRKLIVNR